MAGPVGAVQLHYGDCLDDVRYNDILVSACARGGIAAFTGDGTDGNVMIAATKAIRNADGVGIPTVKPWNIETIREKSNLSRNRAHSPWLWISMRRGCLSLRILHLLPAVKRLRN